MKNLFFDKEIHSMAGNKTLFGYADDEQIVEYRYDSIAKFYNNIFNLELLVKSNRGIKIENFIIKFLVDRFGKDRKSIERELRLIPQLRRIGLIVPEYIFEDLTGSIYGWPFVIVRSCGNKTLAEVLRKNLIDKLLENLFLLHTSTLNLKCGWDEPILNADKYGRFMAEYLWQDMRLHQINLDGSVVNKIQQWENSLHLGPFALCHGDLGLGNIVTDGTTLAIIDWTYARYCEPAYDYAFLIFGLLLTGHTEETKRIWQQITARYSGVSRIEDSFWFYFGYKSLEHGKYKGKKFIELGQRIIAHEYSFEKIIESFFKES